MSCVIRGTNGRTAESVDQQCQLRAVYPNFYENMSTDLTRKKQIKRLTSWRREKGNSIPGLVHPKFALSLHL